jgi:ATP-dependent Clp protease adaptor protein ClpS
MPNPSKPPQGPNTADPRGTEEVDVLDRSRSATPRLFKVIFHNDDYTTREFVVEVLKAYFHKTETEATFIMLTVHTKGSGVAGVYTRDIAETKVRQVMTLARQSGMPLLLTAEPE